LGRHGSPVLRTEPRWPGEDRQDNRSGGYPNRILTFN
jgi:hypothetical protein